MPLSSKLEILTNLTQWHDYTVAVDDRLLIASRIGTVPWKPGSRG
jgi:hypothetical protein